MVPYQGHEEIRSAKNMLRDCIGICELKIIDPDKYKT